LSLLSISHFHTLRNVALLVITSAASALADEPVTLEQVISRHDPALNVAEARLAVGLDGDVFLASPHGSGGYVLRVSADGRTPSGGKVGYSLTAVAANREGVVATSEAHFAHRTAFWGKSFAALGHVPDFLVSDLVQWNAPSDVCAGESGSFYAIDQHRLRILKVAAPDKLEASYSLEQLGVQSKGATVGLRVDEKNHRFVVAWPGGTIWSVAFDGRPLWSIDARPAGEPPGGFDLDADGKLYVIAGGQENVSVFDVAGKPAGEVKLASEPGRALRSVFDLRVLGDELVVKRSDPTALFEVYDRATGEFRRRVGADVEVLRVRYLSAVWTESRPVPFEIAFDAGLRATKPSFRAFLRPLGVPEFTELALENGAVTPPDGVRGLCQLRVTPDIGGRVSENTVDGFVEIRAADAQGSVSIFTPLNRFYYAKGEVIAVSVVSRAPSGSVPLGEIDLVLKGPAGTVLKQPLRLSEGKAEFIISAQQTLQLLPGRYVVDADVPHFTVAPQYLELGPGRGNRADFHIVQHGDYSAGFPAGPRPNGNLPRLADAPETVADHLLRCGRLGLNLFVDRLGIAASGLGEVVQDERLVERLKADPLAPVPEKAVFEGAVRRAVAGYGAAGIEEQALLLYMDAGLPLGTLFDNRKPEIMDADLKQATQWLRDYPAFRGWSWAANWWLEKHGTQAARGADEAAEYTAALKAAKETGAWSAVLDTVSDRTFAHAVQAEKRFRAVLESVAPEKRSVMTGPYRAIETHPPIIFAGADEVDLHYQAEQIQPPQVTPHHVDFYKRPGKPAWGHPELWNDDGTGGMIFPTLLQMVMRGVDGVGQSGPVGPWGGFHPDQSDPRCGAAGTTSAYRALYEWLKRDGPWLRTLENADRVAIVVSTRMRRIETWDGKIGSASFDTLFEAYNACLYAHRPASFVYVEDLKPDTLDRFDAVLIAGQQVEFEAPLLAALRQRRGSVFYDGSCRPELVREFQPLGVTFDRVRNDPHAWQDDAAYDRFPRYFQAHAKRLNEVLDSLVPPVAGCVNPQIMLTERTRGDARFVWAVNNTMLGWDPGLAWQATLLMSQRVPVVEKLKLNVPAGCMVYDVFARKGVDAPDGEVTCDLRTMPVRLYAILPAGAKLPADGPPRDGPPLDERFGPHVRDLCLSRDGTTALANTFNWDHNLYAIDVATGATRWRSKVGQTFAFEPRANIAGFSAQGFDILSAEGYHLYQLDDGGRALRRFALFGLPKRATSWASASQLQDTGINSFATSPDGQWTAAAGDLGTVVWDGRGKELWADEWWQTTRKRVRLVAVDERTLVTLDQGTAQARDAKTGATLWTLALADSGALRRAAMSSDGQTLVVLGDTLGGRLFVIRDGHLVNTIATAADDLSVSADGSFVAAVYGRQLKAIDPLGGLLWTFTGDDVLRQPRISPDGKRIAVGSELGTLTLVDRSAATVAQRDMIALAVTAWLPAGDLLAATWMGAVARFDAELRVRWQVKLAPAETDARSKLLVPDATPTVVKSGWGNATASPLPLSPNLLAQTKATIEAVSDPRTHGDPRPWQNPIDMLTDGKPDAPPKPWLEWTDIGYIDSGWRSKFAIEVDAFRTHLRVEAVTFVEDAKRPESWLRDMRLEWWDASAEVWRTGPYLLSNAPVHTHLLDAPIEATKFRFVTTGGGSWPVGNIRLGELVFHGEALGPSHPDAVAKRPLATLFDENEADLRSLKRPDSPFEIQYTGAPSGGKCLSLKKAGSCLPDWRPPFGHALPNWNFEIAESPALGQYRYLRFAWKADSAETTGMSLLLGRAWPGGGVAVSVGNANWSEGVIARQHIDGNPPIDWKEVTVDLWAVTKGQPPQIQAIGLLSVGGGAQFDLIQLARTIADFEAE
jgi:outer membrane protein assembly factor BamB